eukprot:2132092-Rhodomonas_salina.1
MKSSPSLWTVAPDELTGSPPSSWQRLRSRIQSSRSPRPAPTIVIRAVGPATLGCTPADAHTARAVTASSPSVDARWCTRCPRHTPPSA